MEHYLTYNGKINDSVGKVKGPNFNGDYFVVTGQMYDPNTNKTILEFKKYEPNS